MADKLQKYKFTAGTSKQANPKPITRNTAKLATQGGATHTAPTHPSGEVPGMAEDLKAEILASIREDLKNVIRDELKSALTDELSSIKNDLQGLKTLIANDVTAIRADMELVKTDVNEVKDGLNTWSDEVSTLQTTVENLQKEIKTMRDKCEDMEGRMRRANIRLAGIPEANSSTPKAIASALKEMLQLDRDVKVDRSHRIFGSSRDGDKPRVIIAKMHYDEDAVEILRKARDKAPLFYNGQRVSIFPDYTANVAKARAAFSEVRSALRGRKDIRYGLLFPARLRITHNGNCREFVDHRKAMDYAKQILMEERPAAND